MSMAYLTRKKRWGVKWESSRGRPLMTTIVSCGCGLQKRGTGSVRGRDRNCYGNDDKG